MTKLFYLFIFFLGIGCKTNQKINKLKESRWIESTVLGSNTTYSSKGKYRHNEPIKKWKHYVNNKIYKKEI